jgi:hypothetical protein
VRKIGSMGPAGDPQQSPIDHVLAP